MVFLMTIISSLRSHGTKLDRRSFHRSGALSDSATRGGQPSHWHKVDHGFLVAIFHTHNHHQPVAGSVHGRQTWDQAENPGDNI